METYVQLFGKTKKGGRYETNLIATAAAETCFALESGTKKKNKTKTQQMK